MSRSATSLRRTDLAQSLQLTPSGVTRLLDGLDRGDPSRRLSAPPTPA
jgi:hypothetical protein